jgi:hypothetical protein
MANGKYLDHFTANRKIIKIREALEYHETIIRHANGKPPSI